MRRARGRDPDSCDIQIRLPEVSKRQAKIESDDQDKARSLRAPSASAALLSQTHAPVCADAGLAGEHE